MPYVRLHETTKRTLERIGGKDYSIDDVVTILLENFIDEDDDEDDEGQMSLFDYDED